MSIFSRIKQLVRGENQLFRSMLWMLGNGMPVTMDDDKEAYIQDGYAGNPDVYSIITKIALNCTRPQLRVYTSKGDEATDHEALALVTPETINNHYIFKFSTGDAYLYAPKIEAGNNRGKAMELYVMPSPYVEIISGGWMQPVRGYRMTLGETGYEFNTDEVCHDKFFNPDYMNGYMLYGLSPIKVAANVIAAQNEGYLANAKAFKNMGPPYILTNASSKYEDFWTSEQQERIEAKFEKKYGGGENFRKPMISGGKIDVTMLGLSPVDLNIIESNRQGMRTLCNVLGGVPSGLFNDNEQDTYNNVKERKKALYTNVIIPNNKHFAQKLTQFLLPKGFYFEFDYSEIEELQEDLQMQVSSLRDARWLSDNEKRVIMGYDPLPDPLADIPESLRDYGFAPSDDQINKAIGKGY